MSQTVQMAAALQELRDNGALDTPALRALAAMIAGVAESVDRDPENASLWKELRQFWAELREEIASGGSDDADPLYEALNEFNSAASVRDASAAG